MQSLLAQTTAHDPYFQWVLIALAVGTIVYTAVIRPAMKRKNDPLERPPSMGKLSSERHVERQMQNLLVELSEMTRQISAQLDTRGQKLQLLIQDADDRIALLQKLQNDREAPKQDSVWVVPQTPKPVASQRDAVDEPHRLVYALADRGQSATDIARELNRPRGEVELILALRPRVEV